MLGKWVIFASLASVMTVGLGTAVAQESPRNMVGFDVSFNYSTLPSGIIPGNKNVSLNGMNGKFGITYGNPFGGNVQILGVFDSFNGLNYNTTASTTLPSGGVVKGGSLYTGNPMLVGGEVLKNFHLANLGHDGWQLGLAVGGGIGMLTGNITQQHFTATTTAQLNPTTGAFTFTPAQGPTLTTTQSASKTFSNITGMSVVPLVTAQLVVAKTMPHMRAEFFGGLDFPGIGGGVNFILLPGR